jgi:outer membrane immunogenic protein
MKKILVATFAMAVLSAAQAGAADMATPFYKAPPVRTQSWEGPYLGAHLGYDWGRTRVLDNGVLAEAGAPTDGIIGGGLVGYNWQRDRFVFGLEGDIGAANLKGTGTVALPPNAYAVDWAGNIRARVGYLVWPQTLFFVAGGFSFADFTFTHGGSSNSFTTVRPGWTVGGGIDQLILANLILRLEYLYADYGNKTYEVLPGDFYSAAFKSQTFRGAVIWKFAP